MQSSFWDPVETVSQEEMAALQAERLSDCLARMVVSVPFYPTTSYCWNEASPIWMI